MAAKTPLKEIQRASRKVAPPDTSACLFFEKLQFKRVTYSKRRSSRQLVLVVPASR
jgi:hypothetical protein